VANFVVIIKLFASHSIMHFMVSLTKLYQLQNTFYLPTDTHNAEKRRVIKTF